MYARRIFPPTCSCDLGSLIAGISSALQKLQQNGPTRELTFRSNYDYSTSELFQNLKRPKLIVHQ